MPELPEVEVTRLGLEPQIAGRVISAVAVREPRRSALGLLVSCLGEAAWSLDQLAPLRAFESGERSVLHHVLIGMDVEVVAESDLPEGAAPPRFTEVMVDRRKKG